MEQKHVWHELYNSQLEALSKEATSDLLLVNSAHPLQCNILGICEDNYSQREQCFKCSPYIGSVNCK